MKNGLITAGEQLLSRAADVLEHHPRHVTALVAALLLGGGGAAFAVASLGPDPTTMRVQQVLEAVQPFALNEQADEIENRQLRLFRSDTMRASDTVDALLARLSVSDAAAAAYLRTEPTFRANVRAGRSVTAETTPSNELARLTARWVPDSDGSFKRLVVERGSAGAFTSRIESAPLSVSTRMGSAVVRSSLFAAADEGGVPDAVAVQLADIFSGEIDFHRSLRKGDRFEVVYEVLEADGEPLRTGRILSAELVNRGTLHQAIWFQEPGHNGGYFAPDGNSLLGAFLASPMEFSRVTSGFSMRMHPILHQWKAHLGVDYGAPTGTPVRVIGDGVIEFAGVQNGFGNVVVVRHNRNQETVYAHLSRIMVAGGQPVRQGQHIGAVGSTGWATGPHLHFEFRVNGMHQDPQQVAHQAHAATISAEARPAFERVARSMQTQLNAASSMVASAD